MKRKPGHPKGSRNKSSARNVGRPRKDGLPPVQSLTLGQHSSHSGAGCTNSAESVCAINGNSIFTYNLRNI